MCKSYSCQWSREGFGGESCRWSKREKCHERICINSRGMKKPQTKTFRGNSTKMNKTIFHAIVVNNLVATRQLKAHHKYRISSRREKHFSQISVRSAIQFKLFHSEISPSTVLEAPEVEIIKQFSFSRDSSEYRLKPFSNFHQPEQNLP